MTPRGKVRTLTYVTATDSGVERSFDAGEGITIGSDPEGLVIPGWAGESVVLISGDSLHLRPGMRVNMCDDVGGDRLVGEFEELAEAGTQSKVIPIRGRRINVRVSAGITVFIQPATSEDES